MHRIITYYSRCFLSRARGKISFLIIFLFVLSFFPGVYCHTPLTLSSLDGTQHNEDEFFSYPKVVFMFWTSWCHYCKVKLREFNRGDLCEESVPVFFINIGEKQPVVKEFAGRMKLRECMYNNILMDKEGALAAKMGVVGIPMFILFEDGKEAGRGYSLDKNFMDEAFD